MRRLQGRATIGQPVNRTVLAIGGSIIAPEGDQDPQSLVQWTEAVKEWCAEVQPLIVVGGGAPARKAIELARHASTIEEDLDLIGIAATRLNANVFLTFLKGNGVDTYHHVPRTVEETAEKAENHDVVVMGGTEPGHSTDYVAATLAKEVGADRIVIVTNVDGVYTADPNKDDSATKFESMTHDELLEVVGSKWTSAGANTVVDGPCAKFLKEHGIEACVVSGRNLTNIGKAVRGEDFNGTRIGGAQ